MSANPNSTDYQPPNYETCADGVSARCPVEASLYGDYFNLGACIFFVVAHALALIPQIYFGIRARTWSYMIWLAIGTIFELVGYCGRVVMSSNPWVYNAFVIQLVLLILGPTLVAAAISITFKHLVLWHGREYSFMKPVLYPWVFVGTDLFSIVIQAAGGGISSAATNSEIPDQNLLDVGSGMLVAGVVFQLVNMIFCGGLMLVYIWRRHKAIKNGSAVRAGEEHTVGGDVNVIRASDKKTKMFVFALTAAYVAIIIRCIYRIPEMQMGWGSTLMQNETTFLILDGTMILISVWTLTIFHPYFFFPFMGSKGKAAIADAEKSSSPETNQSGPVMHSS